MVKYSKEATSPESSVKAMGCDLRVSFKNTYNVAQAIKGKKLEEAKQYLQAVIDHQRCIPFRRFKSGVGRCAQAKEHGVTQGRWPQKSCKMMLGLLQNAESNASYKNLDVDNLVISHIQTDRAQRGRRRTYRAHGRINAYMSQPCHVQILLSSADEDVAKSKEAKETKFTKKQMAKKRMLCAN